MATAMVPPRKVAMVLWKRIGEKTYTREQYNILKWGGAGLPIKTFLEPAGLLLYTRGLANAREVIDDVRIYDKPPFPMSGIA
jgi:hypothetical protein